MISQTDSTSRDPVLSRYLHYGLPSVLLAVVATVVSVYSYWFVAPGIQFRYEMICERNFERLDLPLSKYANVLSISGSVSQKKVAGEGLAISETITKLSDTNKGTDKTIVEGVGERASLSEEERFKIFEDTQLCLRRLTISEPQDELPRLQAAILAQAFADWYRHRAWDLANNEDSVAQVAEYLAGERYQLGKAMEAMRSVERLEGSLSSIATAWILERQMGELALAGGNKLSELAESARQSLGNKVDGKWLPPVLARLAVMEALEPRLNLSNSARLQKLAEATRILSENQGGDLKDLSWVALAELPFDREKAQENSWNSVQQFWANSASLKSRASDLDSVLRSMLVGGVFEEAESFVQNQLKKLPPFEQSDLRTLASYSCLRQVIASYLSRVDETDPSDGQDSQERIRDDVRLMDFAVRLRADSNSLADFLIELATMDAGTEPVDEANPISSHKSLESHLLWLFSEPKGDGLQQIVAAIRQSKSTDSDESGVREAVENVCRNDASYSILAMRVALSLAGNASSSSEAISALPANANSRISHDMAIVWLSTINETSPDLLDAWFARGSLHLTNGEKEEANKCFSYLLDRLPGNTLVAEKLRESKAN